MTENKSIVLYTLEDYEADLREAWGMDNIGQKRALSGAANKRYKQTVIFHWLEKVELQESVDLTPTLALHLVKGWIGRGIDRLVLNKWFMITGRTAKNKSEDHHRKDKLIEKYSEPVASAIIAAENEMKQVKSAVARSSPLN